MLLKLFLTFLKIGAVSFGGGYGMLSLIKDECITNGWLTEEQILNFIAVAESTPGPIAINMATFIGSSQAGILGSALATIGVVLPSFVIILLIVTLISKFLEYKGVKAVLNGIRPTVIGLILGTSLTLFISVIFNISTIKSNFIFNYTGLIIFGIIIIVSILYKLIFKKKINPILLIIFSGILGILL